MGEGRGLFFLRGVRAGEGELVREDRRVGIEARGEGDVVRVHLAGDVDVAVGIESRGELGVEGGLRLVSD